MTGRPSPCTTLRTNDGLVGLAAGVMQIRASVHNSCTLTSDARGAISIAYCNSIGSLITSRDVNPKLVA